MPPMSLRSPRTARPVAGLLLLLCLGAASPSLAQVSAWSLAASASPLTVAPGGRVTYEVTVGYVGAVAANGVSVAHTLPTGFVYVPGTAQIFVNNVRVSSADPVVSGRQLTWSSLTLPAPRAGSHYGMHTFVQDRCQNDYIRYQLDRALELMGPGAFVKQLFYGITTATAGPEACWVYFVNEAYNRGLIPVVRLQGVMSGGNWAKPPAASPGDYSAIAAAYARVVSGLPRRDGATLYVEVWNEPNLNLEWSGAANAVEYAEFLVDVAAAVRALGDGRIKLLNGGLSAGPLDAPSAGISPSAFIDAMATVPGALQAFDVWASHPYPGNRPPAENLHDGTASAYPYLAVDAYLLELQRLADHGRSGLQVLLTETGYQLGANNLGFMGHPAINESNRAAYMVQGFRDHWSRWPEVLGVCPFELVDPIEPSPWRDWDWLYRDGHRHAQYDAVRALDKTPALAPARLLMRFEAVAAATPGVYTSQVAANSANAGGASASGLAPVTVAGATPSPSPSPSPTVTVTPSPTPPSTPPPGQCGELLVNGGFEGDAGWELLGGYPADYSTALARSGQRALRVGIVEGAAVYSYSSAWQSFSVPEDADAARLEAWLYPLSQDLRGVQRVWLMNEQRAYLETIWQTASNAAQWQQVTYDLSAHAGQTRWLYLGVYNPGGASGITGMYVDDVSILACRPATVFTPTMQIMLPIVRQPATESQAVLSQALPSEEALPQRPLGLAVLAEAEPAAVDDPPPLLALDATRQRVVQAAGGRLRSLDALTGRVLAESALREQPAALAVDAASGAIHLLDRAAGRLTVLDMSHRPLAQVEGLGRPSNLALSSERVYVADPAGERLLAIARGAWYIMTERRLEAAPHALAYDPLRQRLYVGLMGRGEIVALDAATLEAQGGPVALGGLGLPQGMALDAAAGRLAVAHSLSPKYGAVSVLSVEPLALQRTRWGNLEETLGGAAQAAFGPASGELALRVAGRALLLDAETLATRREVALGGAGPLAADPLSRTLYLAASDGGAWSWRE